MTAARLRAAATKLRTAAEEATPGPWDVECVGSEGWHVFGPRGLDERLPLRRPRVAACTWGSFESDKADARLIALLRPLAEPVADWLEIVADGTLGINWRPGSEGWFAQKVADAVLGGES